MTAAPLKLSDKEAFGLGGRRLCYVHPDDASKCIKVLRTDEKRTVRISKRRIIPARFRRVYDNNADEQMELESLERRIGRTEMSRHFPASYGMTETDLGPGLVLDLVRDADGGISRNIRELITNGQALSTLRPAFDQLGNFLLKHRVVTRQLLDHNIAASHVEAGHWRFVIIDGLGDRAWLPLSKFFAAHARRRITNNLNKAWQRFESFSQQGGVTKEMLRHSTWGEGLLIHRDVPSKPRSLPTNNRP